MVSLLLGPVLRYVGETEATIWVEADGPCTVQALGTQRPTFEVEGHHYALLRIGGLEPGTETAYEVLIDGQRVWPDPHSPFPASAIRTLPWPRCRIAFGSCRTILGDVGDGDPDRLDALRELALRAAADPGTRPDALMLLGDQIYSEKGSPAARAFARSRRDTTRPPGEAAADFEEYTRLYHEAWGDPPVRWLLSTAPSTMIFDDHDVVDNWNTSESWAKQARRQPWWSQRVTGALMAYWLYQHLGNLTPDALDRHPLLRELEESAAGAHALRRFAAASDVGTYGTPGAQWSFARDLGRVRVLMVDSRAGRCLEDGRREMLDEDEWAWLEEQAGGDVDHLLIATSVPFLLPHGVHDYERWVTALCAGAWGRRVARRAERIRRDFQFNHWASFPSSSQRLVTLLRAVSESRGAPATVLVVSGDVHYSYLARLEHQRGTPVHQVVSSPLCYDLEKSIQGGFRIGMSGLGKAVGRLLARLARAPRPAATWQLRTGPWFRNVVAVLELSRREASVRFEHTLAQGRPGSRLAAVAECRLDAEGASSGGCAADAGGRSGSERSSRAPGASGG